MKNIIWEQLEQYKSNREIQNGTHISLVNDYVYFQISKAGSSSVKYFLQTFEFRGSGRTVKNVNNKFFSPHISPFQVGQEKFLDMLISPTIRKTTFVRNPYTRLLSCYLHRIVAEPDSASNRALLKATGGKGGKDVTFDEFIEVICAQDSPEMEGHWRVQHEELFGGQFNLDFVGKLESLRADLAALIGLVYGAEARGIYENSADRNASPMRTGSSDKVKKYYQNDRTVDRVLERYGMDFQASGYSIELP